LRGRCGPRQLFHHFPKIIGEQARVPLRDVPRDVAEKLGDRLERDAA